MTIKIYNVIGMGLLMGEKIKQDDDKIFLKYPGVVLPNQRTQQGQQHLMIEPVHDFFAGKKELLENFPIKKLHVIYSGAPSKEALMLYDNYLSQVREKRSGLKIVGADAMKRLPVTGKGEPVI